MMRDEGEGDESLPSSPPARTTGRLKRTNSSAFTPPRGAFRLVASRSLSTSALLSYIFCSLYILRNSLSLL